MLRFSTLMALMLTVSAGTAVANIVVNPGFETGDFTGWSTSGTGISIDGAFPNAGNFDAAFGAESTDLDPGILSQDLATTTGKGYLLSFALLDEAGFSGDSFTVTFGGFDTTITGDMAAPPGDLPSSYTAFSFVVPGAEITASTTTLSFQGIQNPLVSSDWNLDDVSLVVVADASTIPEPSSWALLGLAAITGFLGRRHRFAA